MPTLRFETIPSADETFDAGDGLSRVQFANTILNLASYYSDAATLLVDSGWGTGKTRFAIRLRNHFRAHGYPTVYFDSFAADLSDDAVSSVSGSIYALLAELTPKKTQSSFLESVAKVAVPFATPAARLLASVATGGVLTSDVIAKIAPALNEEGARNVAKAIQEVTADSTQRHMEQQIKAQAGLPVAINQLRGALDVAAKVASKTLQGTTEPTLFKNTGEKLIVIVDELDRCRPNFALSAIEVIRHLMNTPKVMFIVFADVEQLSNSIRHIYGQGLNAEHYLERFYDLRLAFPRNRNVERSETAVYLGSLRMKFSGADKNFVSQVIDPLQVFADNGTLSFRTAEKICTRLRLIVDQMKPRTELPQTMLAFLLLMERLDRPLLENIRKRRATVKDVRDFLKIDQWQDVDDGYRSWVMQWFEVALLEVGELRPETREWADRLPRGLRGKSLISYLFDNFIDTFNPVAPTQS